jgi:hypothetical protein
MAYRGQPRLDTGQASRFPRLLEGLMPGGTATIAFALSESSASPGWREPTAPAVIVGLWLSSRSRTSR